MPIAVPRRAPATSTRSRRLLFVGAVLLLAAAAGLVLNRRSPQRPNVLLITIDTLRADRVGAYGHREPTTPVLDALAARGVRFASAQSASPLTGPSHATLLTGHYPPVHGVRDNARFTIGARSTTLAERLSRLGYQSAAFVAAFPLAGAFGFGRGFAVFDEGLVPAAQSGQVAERPADAVAGAALPWLQAAAARDDAPFFAWVHFFDPHQPYAPPEPLRARFADPYDGEIAFVDSQVGRLLEVLRRAGVEERTIVIVVSDHGESLGEHGESTHGLLLYEATLRVPLLMAGPGVPAGRVVEERVGTIDVLPTLLGLLGQPLPEGLHGRDLRPSLAGRELRPEPLYAESLYGRLNCRWAPLRAWTHGDLKLIAGQRDELFDLATDPAERDDLAAVRAPDTTRLRGALERALAAMAPGGDRASPAALSATQAESLRALGYVAGGGGGGALDAPGLPDPRDRVATLERLRVLGGAAGEAAPAALAEALSLARSDADNPLVHELVVGLAVRTGQLALAAEALGRFVELVPERVEAREQLGSLLRSLGRLEEAERELRRAVAESPAGATGVRVALADTLIARGSLPEAEALLDGVLARERDSRAALLAQARLKQAQDRGGEALALLEAVAEAGGNDQEALLALAEAYAQAGRPRASLQVAERVLSVSPAHPWALGLAGHALAVEGRRAEALALLQDALRAGPRRSQVWSRLAAGFEAAGEPGLATRCRVAARTAP